MKSIAFDEENGKYISARIRAFFKRYQVSEIPRKSNAYKQQGISVLAIAGYCRISVDGKLGRDNVSIENQRAIIDYRTLATV